MELEVELDLHQMDAFLLYLCWSLLPGKVCLLPSVQGTTVRPNPSLGEELEQQNQLGWLFARAELVLVPIWAGGHWTLLWLERQKPEASSTAAASEAPETAAASEAPETAAASQAPETAAASQAPKIALSPVKKAGCPKCPGSAKGCSQCCPLKSQLLQLRKEEEQKLFDPASWEPLPLAAWTAKVYDPLPKESTASRAAGVRILRAFADLGWPQELPPGEPGLRQKDCVSCGFYCLHWADACLREYRGEGPTTMAFEPKKTLEKARGWFQALAVKAQKAREAEAKAANKKKKEADKKDS